VGKIWDGNTAFITSSEIPALVSIWPGKQLWLSCPEWQYESELLFL